jgi:hypothetical protein
VTQAQEAPQFSEWLAEHRRGALDDEISAALLEVIQQTQAVGDPKKSGKVTIELSVSTSGPDSPTILLVDKVKVSKPEHGRPASVYYLDASGGMHRNDPMQIRIPGTTSEKGE